MSKKFGLLIVVLLISISVKSQKPGDRINSVFEDEYGCQWFGTDNGLLRKCGDTWNAYAVESGSPGIVNDIKHSSASSGSVLWAGTMKGIIRITYSAGSVNSATRFSSNTNSFLSDTIRRITLDKYASVFFATPSGIGLFTNAAWKFIDKLTDVLDNRVTSVTAKGDTIFFGTIGEGVGRLVRSVDGYSGASSLVAPWSGLAGDNITCIFVDSKGHRWFGTDKGLTSHSKFDAKEGWNETFTGKLTDRYVSSIAEDKSGNIWVGTHGGLVCFRNGSSDSVTRWTDAEGLPSGIINDIFIDKDDHLWIGTDMGASHFNGSKFENFRTSDYARNFTDIDKLIK